jgi:hypothetical protein
LSKQEREQAEKADDERRKTREEEHITKSPHRHLLVNSYLLPWPLQIQNETPSGIGIPQPVRRIRSSREHEIKHAKRLQEVSSENPNEILDPS